MKAATHKRAIALGFFDGVHLGHGALLERTVAVAGAEGLTPAALTFDTHPGSLLTGAPTPLLTTPADRAELMERLYGVEEVLVAPFDRGMMTLPWDRFVTGYLVDKLAARHLVAGHDYRFGYRGEGTAEKLAALCARLGLGCDVIPRVTLEGVTVSSTHIRALVEQGEVEKAARFLGHPYALTGAVVHGRGLGGRLGFPTANLAVDPALLLPARGVYAAVARLSPAGAGQVAVVNVGTRPTVEPGGAVTAEAFLPDFSGDLYGQTLRLELRRRLREERRFESLEDLRAAVMENARQARAYLGEGAL